MTKKQDDLDDERRSDKRRLILMPIHDERRRGRDRRKAWELRRSSGEIDPLPMARLSGPNAAAASPATKNRESPTQPIAGVPEIERTSAEAPRHTPPAARTETRKPAPSPARPSTPQVRSKPTRRSTAPRTRPPGVEHVTVPAAPPPPRPKPAPKKATTSGTKTKPVTGSKPKARSVPRKAAPQQPDASATPSTKTPPRPVPGVKPATRKRTPARPKAAVAPTKKPAGPPPKPATASRTRSKPLRPSPPGQGAAYANGELWIGVTGNLPDAMLGPRPAAETHRFVETGGGQRFLVTLTHGPVGTVYRAWRPVGRQLKRGRSMQMEGQTFQQIGSEKRTTKEYQLASQTIFAAFPELETTAHHRGAEVVTIDL